MIAATFIVCGVLLTIAVALTILDHAEANVARMVDEGLAVIRGERESATGAARIREREADQ